MKLLTLIATSVTLSFANAQVTDSNEKLPPPPKVLAVASVYVASGGMGDATNGTKFVQVNLSSKENPRPGKKESIKISYTEGSSRWAGTYWLNKPNNWGQRAGDDISKGNYSKITFWVRGETGNEKVEFKAGGIQDGVNKDSFECSTGTIPLSKEWQRKEISLKGRNLSSVIGVFCWTANFDANANSNGITFYLDDMQYE